MPVEADRRQDAVEQLARAADEGQALDVLVAARRLADQHQRGHRDCRRQNTRIFAVNFRLQPSNAAIAWRSSSSVVARAASSRASAIWPSSGTDAVSGAAARRRRVLHARGAGVREGGGARAARRRPAAAAVPAGWRTARPAARCREFGEAVDRVLLDRIVDAGLGIECEQFANVCGQPILESLRTFPRCRLHKSDEGCADPGRYRIASAA